MIASIAVTAEIDPSSISRIVAITVIIWNQSLEIVVIAAMKNIQKCCESLFKPGPLGHLFFFIQ